MDNKNQGEGSNDEILDVLMDQAVLLNFAYDAILTRDIDGRITSWNEGAEKLYGWKEEEVIGKHTKDVLRSVKGNGQDGLISHTIENGSWEGELNRVTREGKDIIVEARCVLRKNAENKPVSIMEISKDITERKRLEKELADYTKNLELRIAERTKELEQAVYNEAKIAAKHKAILENLGEGIIAIDEKGNISRVNRAAEEMVGKKSDFLIGRHYSYIDLKNEKGERVGGHDHPFYKALHDLNYREIAPAYYMPGSDGKDFPIQIVSTPIFMDGLTVGAAAVLRDITHQKEIEKAKNEFISIASHQLRSPLTNLSWYAEAVLNGRDKLTKKQEAYVLEIKNATSRLINLATELLNFSRVELGVFDIEPKPIDVRQIFKEVQEEMKMLIAKKNIHVLENYTQELPVMKLDSTLIRIVCQNLLSNAIKYTPHGKSVEINAEKTGSRLLIKVNDQGIGISPEEQDRIFTKFFRAEGAKSIDPQGNGLGLYITKTIVEYSNGKIWFTSGYNLGTCFYVSLPLVERRHRQVRTNERRRRYERQKI